MLRFIISFWAFTLIIALPPLVAEYLLPQHNLLMEKFWVVFLFFTLLTLMVSCAIIISMSKGSRISVQVFMAASITKLLACMIFALVYLSIYKVSELRFIACFFYLYFLNTIFEIYSLLCNLRHQKLR